eukprot:s1716_g7.t1
MGRRSNRTPRRNAAVEGELQHLLFLAISFADWSSSSICIQRSRTHDVAEQVERLLPQPSPTLDAGITSHCGSLRPGLSELRVRLSIAERIHTFIAAGFPTAKDNDQLPKEAGGTSVGAKR